MICEGGGAMSRSHPENQKEVYKFWLGFFEKITVLIFAAVIVPSVIGQFKYPLTLIIGWSGVVLILLVAMLLLSNEIWHLSKADDAFKGEKS